MAEIDELLPIKGIRLASVAAGIKKNGNDDLVVMAIDESSNCAASFTKNAFCAAPVTLAKQHLSQHSPRALLINSGNANAGTGDTGMQNAQQSCQWLASALGVLSEQVLPFSTGVIGEQLPMPVIQSGITQVVSKLAEENWTDAARGIMTTDTVAKAVSRTMQIGDKKITISGIAKGSGMICPDMATMLAFIATDADVDAGFLQLCLSQAVDDSFNAITVDGDTSTNDACVIIATGKAANQCLIESSKDSQKFIDAVKEVCLLLAQAIVRDAEGATKFVTVGVDKALTKEEARKVAYTIAHSPLVKTALFASDPNWGRILAAVGRAGVQQLDISNVDIFLGDVCIVRGGGVDSNYSEEKGQAVMNEKEIAIRVELGRGEESATIWTSDLSHEYVRINSEYRS
ncbi:MAG: bifunctional glutamate N-acetyltransferase/amino-acid acetyltransferase ArgJ [Gammaproteobacteria bacterium]|nr:bifunctional glutamate N-acetyltransferase/amino-acid acetyltransferase ArgJ [Gammaproteobacteria bacterium]MBT8134274.1 bifunctional glutamate N-acetyltransferase/amino-acid acetyltransferase ArgJ [Gammaproteobacteria bacterium]NNJ50623.1 bifunctional glutamate N-acetyltransferase/amino-acid acetyltransferase ArgJ [Gammaproteobacteria bacterium]